MTIDQLALTPDQAAAAVGKSRRTIDRALNARDAEAAGLPLLRAKRIGRRDLVILREDLVAWLEALDDA